MANWPTQQPQFVTVKSIAATEGNKALIAELVRIIKERPEYFEAGKVKMAPVQA